MRNTEFGFYVADNWKATHRLTVNLGLRYDLNPPYTEAYNRNSFFNPTLSNPAVDGYPGALNFLATARIAVGAERLCKLTIKILVPA